MLGKHNIHFYHQLMREIRESILAGGFADFYREKRAVLQESDREYPMRHPKPARQKSLSLGKYEVHIAHEGFASIRQISSGEIMHSRTPPMEEAHSLYVEQSALQGARAPASADPLVVWDVGLGAAANAMAAIHCYEEQQRVVRCVRCRSSASKTISTRCDSRSGTTINFRISDTADQPGFCGAASGDRSNTPT